MMRSIALNTRARVCSRSFASIKISFGASWVNPHAKVVAGYQPIMPTFQGLVTEEQLLQLIAYVKSLSQPEGTPPAGASAPAPQGGQPEIKK